MSKETKGRWVFLHDIQGYIAMWSVRQSPYHSPAGLLEVLQKFEGLTKNLFDSNSMAFMTREQLREILKYLEQIPEFIAWNERKNGRQGMGICSRYDKPSPDDDFIDLGALTRNVEVSLFRELDADHDFDQKFDSSAKWVLRWLKSLFRKNKTPEPETPIL